MKFSIITATYNSSKNITTCLASVNNQDYKNIEHIIIDGASSDDTLEIIKNYQLKKKTKIISEKDNGIYDALNKGVEFATGDIIGFLHSDDTFAQKNIISKLSKIFIDESVSGVYGNLKYLKDFEKEVVLRKWISNNYHHLSLKCGWMPPHPTLFLKKDVYSEFGFFNNAYKISADYDFIIRIFSSNKLKIKFINEFVTIMKIGGASNKSLRNILQKMYEDYTIIKKNQIGGIITLLMKNFKKIDQFF